MKKENVSVSFDAEKLRATKRYMIKKDANLQDELTTQLEKLYEKYVPSSVREYIDERAEESKPTVSKKSTSKEPIASVINTEKV